MYKSLGKTLFDDTQFTPTAFELYSQKPNIEIAAEETTCIMALKPYAWGMDAY